MFQSCRPPRTLCIATLLCMLTTLLASCSRSSVAGTETGNQGEIVARCRIPVPPEYRSVNGVFTLAGTDKSVEVSEYREWIEIDSVTADSSAVLLFTPLGASTIDTVYSGLTILKSDDGTAVIDPFAEWIHSASITINTSASGFQTAETIVRFPLSVRLTNTTAVLSQIQSGGTDIRFIRADGVPLPYEIERLTADSAEIWVLCDTILPDNATQAITMLWGNSAASAAASGSQVFGDTSAFRGTWHFSDATPPFPNSSNPSLSMNDRRSMSNPSEGIAGYGLHLSTYGDSLTVTNPGSLFKSAQVTVSGWIKPLSIDTNGSEIISMGDAYMLRVQPDSSVLFALFPVDTPIWLEEIHDTANIVDGQWHFVCGTYDGATMLLYVDGTLRASYLNPKGIPYINGNDLVVGRHGDAKSGYQYLGDIDELRIAPYAESADRIALTYESMRKGGSIPSISILR